MSPIHALQREELKVVIFVEPAALEGFQRQAGPAGDGECVDRELHMRVCFFAGLRFVVKDVNVSVADLQKSM